MMQTTRAKVRPGAHRTRRPAAFVRALLVLALASAWSGLASPAQAQDALMATGRVVEAETGSPVRNARVVAPPGPTGWSESVRTDAEGRFRIPVPSRLPAVRVSKAGFVDARRTLQPEGDTLIVMTRGAALTIHVVDAAFVPRRARITMTTVRDFGGNPMAIAGVSTDERGVLRVGNLSAGEYALGIGGGLSIRLPGPLTTLTDEQLAQAREQASRAMAAPGRHSVDLAQMVTLLPGEEASVFLVDLSPAPSGPTEAPGQAAGRGEISGRIADQFGDPVYQAVVLLLEPRVGEKDAVSLAVRATVTSDDRGMFRIGAVPPGTYYVFTRGERTSPEDAHVFFPGRISVGEAQPIDVADGATVTGIDIRLAPSLGVRLMGNVLDSTGRALPRATVELRGVDGSGLPVVARSSATDPAGRFEFRNVPPGQYTLEVNPRRQVLARILLEPDKPLPTPETGSATVRVGSAPPQRVTVRTAPAP
jgi:hypothetical protein